MLGQTFLHYRLLEKIGAGGMGVVYKAEDTQLNRMVALKFISQQWLDDPEICRMFRHEARAAAQINHPNVITIHGIHESAGQTFMVLEYIEGEMLVKRLKGQTLPIERILDYVLQAVTGLQEVHRRGIVHRDVSSANLLVTAAGQVKLMDFGLARPACGTGQEKTAPLMGTAAYMSPEQVQGRPLDARHDLWAMGVVLYELISGRLPFQASHDVLVLQAILQQQPPSLASFRQDLPVDLARIVAKCLEKDVEQRYQSAGDLRADLSRLQHSLRVAPLVELISVERESLSQKKSRKLMRHLAIGLLPVLLLGTFLLLNRRGGQPDKITGDMLGLAVLPVNLSPNQSRSATICAGLSEILTDRLRQWESRQRHFWIIPANDVRQQKILDARQAGELLGAQLVLKIAVWMFREETRLNLILIDTPSLRQLAATTLKFRNNDNIPALLQTVLKNTLPMLDISAAQSPPQALDFTSDTRSSRALTCYLEGEDLFSQIFDKPTLPEAVKKFEEAVQTDPLFAQGHAMLAKALRWLYKRDGDPKSIERAQLSVQRALELNPRLVSASFAAAMIAREMGRHNEAIRRFSEALSNDPSNYEAAVELAITHSQLGNIKQAEAAYRRILQIKPRFWRGYFLFGGYYYFLSKYHEAEKYFLRASQLAPGQYSVLNNLGAVYVKCGRHREAQRLFEKSYQIQANADSCSNLGTLYFFQRRFREASQMYRKALQIRGNEFLLWGNLADSLRYLPDEADEKTAAYQRALSLVQSEISMNPKNQELLGCEALYLVGLNRFSEALASVHKARKLAPDDLDLLKKNLLVLEAAGKRSWAILTLRELVDRGDNLEELRMNPDLTAFFNDPLVQGILVERVTKK